MDRNTFVKMAAIFIYADMRRIDDANSPANAKKAAERLADELFDAKQQSQEQKDNWLNEMMKKEQVNNPVVPFTQAPNKS